MDLEKIKSNQFQTICKFSIPAIIAMVMTSMITIADGYFTGNYVGEEGIAAINLGLPIVYLYLGLGLMISVGGSAIASMALGGGQKDKANAAFNQTMVTTVLISITVSFAAVFSFQPILEVLNVSGQTAEYFKDYYIIMLLELPVLVINSAFGMFIRGEGNPRFFMNNSIINVLVNIFLDYLFAGRLNMGIKGIAAASLISSCLCLVLIIRYFILNSKTYKLQKFVFERNIFKRTVQIGFAEFINEISMSITMFGYNLVIIKYIGVNGVTAFTIVGYIAYIFSMIILGFGQGISPLVSFAHGAQEQELSKSLRRKTNICVFVIGAVVIVLMIFLSGSYSSFFVKNENVRDMIENGIPIFVLAFLFSGINTITSFYFASIGKAKEASVISILKGLVILLMCIIILPKIWGMTGVWMAAPVTEALTMTVCIYYITKNDLTLKADPCQKESGYL